MEDAALIERVSTLYDLKRYEEGVRETSKALASYPQSFPLHYFLGLFYLALEHYAKAREANLRAIAIEPDHPAGHYLRSLLAHELLNFNEELEAAKEAVRLDSEDTDYLQRLSEAQLQSGLLQQAQQTAEDIVRIDPNSETAHKQFASICLTLEQWAKAEKHYRAALAINPHDVYTLHNLSFALDRQRKNVESLEVLHQAIIAAPANQDIKQRLDGAISSFLPSRFLQRRRQKALEQMPKQVYNYYMLNERHRSLSQRYPIFVNVVIWGVLLAVVTVATNVFLDNKKPVEKGLMEKELVETELVSKELVDKEPEINNVERVEEG